MKKVLFICQNVDSMSKEDRLLVESLTKAGFEVKNHETEVSNENELKTVVEGYNFIVFPTEDMNGFHPAIMKDNLNDKIVFSV